MVNMAALYATILGCLPNGARVYLPYRYPERTQADVLSAAQEAESDCCAVKGILGKSPLSKLLNIVYSVLCRLYACLLRRSNEILDESLV